MNSNAPRSNALALDDIADLRAYERERVSYRAQVMELKERRRVDVGPFITVLFENRETVRFQIQEMARVERLLTDEAIQEELDIYNPLISGPGKLCVTLFIELTTDEELREWLPKLVGIERAMALEAADGTLVRSAPEAQHGAQLTREAATAAVHFLVFAVDDAAADALARGPVALVCDHPAYPHRTPLRPETAAELLADLGR